MPHIYEPTRSWETVALDRCRHAAHDDYGVGFHQCTRKGKHEWADPKTGKTYLLCKQHHPDTVAAREKACAERHRRKCEASERRFREQRLHRDIAREVVDLYESSIVADRVEPLHFSSKLIKMARELYELQGVDR